MSVSSLYNLARMSTATTGTGTITLASNVAGYLTFAQAGVTDGQTVSYGIFDGNNSEVGTGTYTSSGTTLTRNVIVSTNSNTAISLSGNAQVYIVALNRDIVPWNLATTELPTVTSLPAFTSVVSSFSRAAGVAITGTNTNDNASAGYKGEYTVASVAQGSAVSITTATAKTVTSISLTAGDWDVSGSIGWLTDNLATITRIGAGISVTNNTFPASFTDDTQPSSQLAAQLNGGINPTIIVIPKGRQSLATTTTIYLVAVGSFTSTASVFGFIAARRIR